MKQIVIALLVFFVVSCNEHADQHDQHRDVAKDTAQGMYITMHTIMQNMEHEMHQYNYSNDPDKDFAALMRMHHEAAVRMAEEQVSRGKDTMLVSMARQIIADQQREITIFDGYAGKAADNRVAAFSSEMQSTMHHPHTTQSGNTVDSIFAQLMIPHHQGAVEMSRVYLKYSKDDQLKQVATGIIAAQEKEIALFNDWLGKQ